MKRITLLFACMAIALPILAQVNDSIRVVDLEEVLVVSSPKENLKLREQSLASSLISPSDLQNRQLTSLKNVSAYVPNFIMADYGSRLTSSIYIRHRFPYQFSSHWYVCG